MSVMLGLLDTFKVDHLSVFPVEPMANFPSHVDRGCVMTGGSRILLVGWVLLMAFDTRKCMAMPASAAH